MVTISQLASLEGVTAHAVKLRTQRGRYAAIHLNPDQALQLGFRRPERGRPPVTYISIADPAVSDRVRRNYYEQKLRARAGAPSMSTSGGGRILSVESPKLLRFPLPETLRPGEDTKHSESAPAAGLEEQPHLTISSSVTCHADGSSGQSPEPEIKQLHNGASLNPRGEEEGPLPEVSFEMETYARLPAWARSQVDKYLPLVKLTEGMTNAQIKKALDNWNSENPELAVSARSLSTARRRYKERGVAGLASRHGGRAGQTIVRDEWFEYFKSLYLKEGGPSAKSCWTMARGKFPDAPDFPAAATFMYQLRRRIPTDAIYMARHGEAAWNRRYGQYIERDYSNILCGEVWVSDHAQIDVAAAGEDGKPFFPWLTAWRCMKSGKWLGWLLHKEPPNSDHVFQTFFYAARDHGIPKHIYIDNGKDYRAKDFAGGRTKSGRLTVDEQRARSLCAVLGVSVHFALPYNAQAKNIERDFLKIKESFSKHMPGYRGGHSKERPEVLAAEIRKGRILHAPDFAQLLSLHLFHNLNRAPSGGRNLQGLCPDELYDREAQNVFARPEALAILCMRVSGSRAIGRNGVKDSRNRETYFDDWMLGQKGRRVYLRRDPADPETAWVFDAGTDECLGRGGRVEAIPAIAMGDKDRERLAEAMASKKAARKAAKAYASDVREIPALDRLASMAAGNQMASGYSPAPGEKAKETKEYPISLAVERQEQRQAQDGRADYSAVAPPRRKPRRKIYMTEADRERDEAEKKLMEEEFNERKDA